MYGLWVGDYVAMNVDKMIERAKEFLRLAEKQDSSAPQLIGHRLMGTSLFMRGEFDQALTHLNQAVGLYRPEQHRPLAARFSQDIGVPALTFRSWTLWHLGYPEAALRDTRFAAQLLPQDLGQVPTRTYALFHIAVPDILS